MIGPRKFLSLPEDARERKLWRILHGLEAALRSGDEAAVGEIRSFLDAIAPAGGLPGLAALPWHLGREAVLRAVNGLRHGLGRCIGHEAAEWDLFPPVGEGGVGKAGDPASFTPVNPAGLALPADGPCRVAYCDDIRSPFNLGSIFRTACAFGLDGLILSPACPDPAHPRCVRSAMGACSQVAWERRDFGVAGDLPDFLAAHGLEPVALELGGVPLAAYSFPPRAVVILGSEELGVSPVLLDLCHGRGGVVSIPLAGPKASLNVGVSFGVLANAWRT
jgi:TrmH family RNA methyltransferase